jgi:hypothetical protein
MVENLIAWINANPATTFEAARDLLRDHSLMKDAEKEGTLQSPGRQLTCPVAAVIRQNDLVVGLVVHDAVGTGADQRAVTSLPPGFMSQT